MTTLRCLAWVLVLVTVAGCGEPRRAPRARPARALAAPAVSDGANVLERITVDELGFSDGDTVVWEIRVRGVALGRFELAARGGAITSRFTTSGLASAIASIEHELVTTLDAHRPAAASERVTIDGTARQFTTALAGTTSHSLHTALGTLRAWARRGATAAGYLEVVVGDRLVRVELAAPIRFDRAVRVDGAVIGLEQPVTLTIWLDAGSRFLRIEVRSGAELITATPAV